MNWGPAHVVSGINVLNDMKFNHIKPNSSPAGILVTLCIILKYYFFKVKNDLGKSSIDDVETCTFFILVGNDYQILFDTTASQILHIRYQSI